MKRLWIIGVFLLVALGTYFVLPAFVTPSGVWFRRVVRADPLKDPLHIASFENGLRTAKGQDLKLAGLAFPSNSGNREREIEFLRLVTEQGVEIVRAVEPHETYILRCEPRIWHWCGNDSVKAHYQQFNLNELLLACGYASFDPSSKGLTANEASRFKRAELYAREHNFGIWNESPAGKSRPNFRPQIGIDISDAMSIETALLP